MFSTVAVPRTSTPVWAHVGEFVVKQGAIMRQTIVVKVIDGVGGGKDNKVIGTVAIEIGKLGGASFVDQWFDIAVKRKTRGKLHVTVRVVMSGMSRLLSSVAVDNGSSQELDENESLAELLKAMPSAVKQLRYTVMRLIYAIGPLLMLRKQAVDLFLWRSKPSSAFAFIAFVYVAYHDLFLLAALMSLACVMAWQAVASLRPGSAFVRAERITPAEVMERGQLVKESARVGAKTSVLSDVRMVIRLLESLAELAEKAREAASDPQRAATIGGVLLGVCLLNAFVDIRDVLAVVARIGITLGVLYAFTLGSLYKNFPLFYERYSPPQLVDKAKRLFMRHVLRRELPDVVTKSLVGRSAEETVRTESELWSMVLRLQSPKTGVPCSDRRTRRRKRIKNAFTAKDAVDWLYSNLALESRREAVSLMRTFARMGAITLVNDDDGAVSAPAVELLASVLPGEAGGALINAANAARSQILSTQTALLRRRRLAGSSDGSESGVAVETAESRRSAPAPTREQTDQAALFADSLRQLWCFNEQRLDLWRTKLDISALTENAPRLSLPTLTDRDWRLMLTGAERRMFAPSTVLVERGVASRVAFHIESGEAQLETDDDGGASVAVGTVGQGAMLGELSMLDGCLTTARVRALTPLSVDMINTSFLRTLFESEPDLCRRFFHNVALQLADQLDMMDSGAPGPVAPVASPFKPIGVGVLKIGSAFNNVMVKAAAASGIKNVAGVEATDDRFNHLFNISGEVVIQEHAAESGAIKLANARGRLFVTQRYLAFHAKVFGRNVRHCLPYATLKSIVASESDAARIKVLSKKDASHKFKLESKKAADEVIKLVNSLLTPGDDRSGASARRTAASANLMTSSSASDYDDETSEMVSEMSSADGAESEILTEDDWDLILASSETVTFRRNEKLFESGVRPLGIVQLAHGQVRVERNNAIIATMGAGIILGEVSFIRNSVASADVVADSDTLEVHVIARDKLHALFVRQVSVGGRFMQYVCRLLQQRINERKQQRGRPIVLNLSK
jgi:CRP-like cAMP-binding protein